MALRVLLADESSTIKRVMQLALQDYAVEVRAVPIGLDVLPVAKVFAPDVIFADVLLPKRSGYDVARDLKTDPETQNIPLVLMWSGFMELDEAKAKESKADRRLEKPFDAENLRSLVQELVKKTRDNPISGSLSFPQLPEFAEPQGLTTANDDKTVSVKTEALPTHTNTDPAFPHHLRSDNSTEEIPVLELPDEEFAQVPLHSKSSANEKKLPSAVSSSPRSTQGGDDEWAHQDLAQFKVQIPANQEGRENFAEKFMIPESDLQKVQVEDHGDFEEITFVKGTDQILDEPSLPESLRGHTKSGLTQSGIRQVKSPSSLDQEQIFREEARPLIENILWKILPEMAERIIREEINRLLQESEKSI